MITVGTLVHVSPKIKSTEPGMAALRVTRGGQVRVITGELARVALYVGRRQFGTIVVPVSKLEEWT